MSVQIELPCGCRINEAFVLGMCPTHAHELADKKRESDEAYRRYEEVMRSAVTSTVSQEKPNGT